MLRHASLVGWVGVVALTLGCGYSTPPDTRDADVAAIKQIEIAWSKDMATKDADKIASYWSDDAVVMIPNEPTLNGREKARDAMKAMVSDPNFAMSFQTTRVEASKGGDMVFAAGTYSATMSDKDKKPVNDKGKYLTVYKKQADGSWKAVADTFNSDLPVSGSAPQ